MVNSIASNIYENLKQNGDVKDILSLVLKKDKRGNMLQDLADSMVLRGMKTYEVLHPRQKRYSHLPLYYMK